MQTLEKNVKNIWGKKGKDWLDALPIIIKELADHWSLTGIKHIRKMSYNFVALALQKNNLPVVLKISCDEKLIFDEYRALKHFDGHGAIKVLDINKKYNALLLEQAISRYLLLEHHPKDISDTIKIYAEVVEALATQPLPHDQYTHVSQWCLAIDRIKDQRIEQRFIDTANELRSFLLNSAKNEYLCHGDLHLENIIQHEKKWLAIDPKGIIGEMAFEAAAFDLLSKNEMQELETVSEKLFDRITKLSAALNLDFNRLLSWIFLRVIISAQWFIEGKGCPNEKLFLANKLYPLLKK